MSELKIQPTDQNPLEYMDAIENESKKEDAKRLFDLCKKATKQQPVMWGNSIIGFGEYTYRRKNEKIDRKWMKIGFSASKTKISVHILSGLDDEQELLNTIGKYKRGVSCLYVNKLADIDLNVLEQLIEKSYHKATFIGQCKDN